jgi:oligopeptide transport system permease protein
MMKNVMTLQLKVNKDDYAELDRSVFDSSQGEMEDIGFWKAGWRRLKKNRIAMTALAVIIILVLFALLGPVLSPYTYDEQIPGAGSLAPCMAHPFGTDRLGRDLLVRCMVGTRISLAVGVVSSIIVLLIGSLYGAISGLAGGRTDMVMMRIVDVIYSVPEILFIVVIKLAIDDPLEQLVNTVPFFHPLQKIGAGLIAIFIVYGCLYWVGMARIVRGQVLQLKEMEYVTAAQALGAGRHRLIWGHLIPNCMGTLIATAMLQIPSAIFTEAFLSFLGIGVSAPMASLGSLTSEALDSITTSPYRMLYPALIISLIILSFNLFGDGLRDALDPKMQK